MKFAPLFAAALALGGATAAEAVTYTGMRTIGTGSANLSITTDGTIGVITGGNITDYTITLTNTDGVFTLTPSNSGVLVFGDALSATAGALQFNFDAAGRNFALFQAPFPRSGETFYCVQTTDCHGFVPGEAAEATDDYVYPTNALSGTVTLATAGVVPEPATWAMMIGGIGLAGGGLRRRRASVNVRFA